MASTGIPPSGEKVAEVIAAGDDKTVQRWIDEGLDLEKRYLQGQWTALHIAASHVKSGVSAMWSLNAGADVNARAANGWTPLHVVCHYGRTVRAELLLERGADIQAVSDSGDTPLDVVRKAGQTEFIEKLSEVLDANSAKHAEKTKRLKVLRDRKRKDDG